jgi:hypothetical protein
MTLTSTSITVTNTKSGGGRKWNYYSTKKNETRVFHLTLYVVNSCGHTLTVCRTDTILLTGRNVTDNCIPSYLNPF